MEKPQPLQPEAEKYAESILALRMFTGINGMQRAAIYRNLVGAYLRGSATTNRAPVRVTDEVVNEAVRAFVTYARVHADERDVTLNAMRATLESALAAAPKEGTDGV